jgi:hypothetical protein
MFVRTVEGHKPGGITGYNLRQNPSGCAYLIVPALVGYQAVQNLLPDILLVCGRNAFFAPLLNGGKPVLEGVLVARRTALPLTPPLAGIRIIFVYSIRDMFVCSLSKHSDIFRTEPKKR